MGRRLPAGPLVAALVYAVAAAWAPTPAAETARPGFCLAEHWPDLPAGLVLGQVAGLGIDSKDVVYVFHRGAKSWGGTLSLADRAMALIARLFEGDTSAEPIAEDTILAIHPGSGALLASFGAGRFRIPHGLTVDAHDNLWVTDVGLHQVFKFSSDGELLLTLGEAGTPGTGPTRFDGPTDVLVDGDGAIFVADGYGNARVVKYSADGEYLLEWGGRGTEPGRFDVPHGIAIDQAGNLYVADRGNARIQVFDRAGRFVRQIAGAGIGRPWAVDVGDDGFLYVVDGGDQDPDNPRGFVLKLTRDGQVIARWSRYGTRAGELAWPHDLAVSARSEVFVGEVFDANRVQKFTPDCFPASPTG